jgi:hypothetical protein
MAAINDALLHDWRGNGQRAQRLLANIPDDRMTEQPHGLLNHPAWSLGHLILAHPAIASLARGEAVADPGLTPEAKLFANGTKPQADPALYPSRAELAERFAQGHALVEEAVAAMDPAILEREPGLERWKKSFGKTGVVLVHMMIWHEAHHLAEVAAWKKVLGITLLG